MAWPSGRPPAAPPTPSCAAEAERLRDALAGDRERGAQRRSRRPGCTARAIRWPGCWPSSSAPTPSASWSPTRRRCCAPATISPSGGRAVLERLELLPARVRGERRRGAARGGARAGGAARGRRRADHPADRGADRDRRRRRRPPAARGRPRGGGRDRAPAAAAPDRRHDRGRLRRSRRQGRPGAPAADPARRARRRPGAVPRSCR